MGLFNKKEEAYHEWQAVHIIICRDYIQIGCGGMGNGSAIDEAMPMLNAFVAELNRIKGKVGDGQTICELSGSGTYAHIPNLRDYSFLAAGIFIGWLRASGWDYGEIIDNRQMDPPPRNPNYWDHAQMQRIRMYRR